MKADWMKDGVVAIYNNPQHPQHGKKCILKSEPYTKGDRTLVDNTLFVGGEHAHLFIPDGFKSITIPIDLLDKHKEAIEYARWSIGSFPDTRSEDANIALIALADALEGGGYE